MSFQTDKDELIVFLSA